MNTEKLYSIARSLQTDLKETQLQTLLGNLASTLQNVVSQPQQPQHQQQLSTHLEQLTKNLMASKVNEFSPLWHQVLEELELRDLLGERLSTRITEIFEHNKITPATAHERIKEIQTALKNKSAAIDQVVTSFNALGLESERLASGECEVGVLIPRGFVQNKLPDLGKELEQLQDIFSVFEEITTGSRPGLIVKSISSSDFGIFLSMAPEVAACTAIAVERILAMYKKYLEIKKLHNELKSQDVPKESLAGIETHLNRVISDGIEKAAKEILKARAAKKLDAGRKNELEIELRLSMNKIANRIDRGFNIEIRCEPPEPDEEVNSQVDTEGQSKYFIEIAEKTKALGFVKSDGLPVLVLPESATQKKGKGKKESDETE